MLPANASLTYRGICQRTNPGQTDAVISSYDSNDSSCPSADGDGSNCMFRKASFVGRDRTFTLLELGPFAACSVAGAGTGFTGAAAGGGFVAAAGLDAGAAGVTFSG